MDAITAEKRIQPVRRVSLQVSINGHDASSAIDPALLDFKFADKVSDRLIPICWSVGHLKQLKPLHIRD